MKKVLLLIIMIVGSVIPLHAQMVQQRLIVPKQFRNFIDTNTNVNISSEYEISVYFCDPTMMKRPRFMALGPHNTVLVADMDGGNILYFPDMNHDGVADNAGVAVGHVDSVHSLAFYHDTLYVAEPTRVRKFANPAGVDFQYDAELPFIKGISDTGYYNHYTRTILVDTMTNHIYLGVGASGNACREGDPERGTVLEFNLDGTGRHVFASGLRNALGLAINPRDSSLWAANADRDGQGDFLPPEIITAVHQNDFFGWPLAYGDHQWENFQATPEYRALLPITATDSANVRSMRVGDVQIPAHSTPMALMFYRDPRTYIKPPPLTAFVALHGSSAGGKTTGIGYKLVTMVYDDVASTWKVSDFLTGFLTDSVSYKYWGRPCGLVQDSAGDIFLSADAGIPAIYRIHLKSQNSVASESTAPQSLRVYPNPATSSTKFEYVLSNPEFVSIEMIDQLGRSRLILSREKHDAGKNSLSISFADIPAGTYLIRLTCGAITTTQKFVVTK